MTILVGQAIGGPFAGKTIGALDPITISDVTIYAWDNPTKEWVYARLAQVTKPILSQPGPET